MQFDINALAKEAELKVYDTALPYDWCVAVRDMTGFWPSEYGFVWCYDEAKTWGKPVALTPAAKILQAFYDKLLSVYNKVNSGYVVG